MKRYRPAGLHEPDANVVPTGGPGQWGWPRLLTSTVCQTVLASIVSLALWAAAPAMLGWKPTTVSTGSMLPRLYVGDVAVSRTLHEPPRIDQVLLFNDPDHPGKLRLHRLVGVNEQGQMITRGDANNSNDSTPVSPAAVEGVALLRVPFIGLPVVWIRERQWVQVLGAATVLLLLAAGACLTPPRSRETPGGGGSTGVDPADGPPPRTRWVRAARGGGASLTVSALLVGLATVAAGTASAGFTGQTSNPTSTLAGAAYWKCRPAVLANNPFLFYPLNELSGSTAVDASGNGRNGTYQIGVALGANDACPRDPGTAVTLNGITGYVSTPTFVTAPNTFTLQTWFKTSTGRGGRLIGFGNIRTGLSTRGDRHVYMTNSGRLVFGVDPSSNETIVSPNGYNDGDWHQVSATLSSAGMKLYVDGQLVASDSTVTAGQSMTGYWRIGYDTLANWVSTPTSRFFAGTLDDVAIYHTSLTAASVEADYEAGR